MTLILHVLFVIWNSYRMLCSKLMTTDDYINDLFIEINEKQLHYNRIAAEINWKISTESSNDKLSDEMETYEYSYINWQHRMCEILNFMAQRQYLNDTQERQMYLLCRGAKYTMDEVREASKIYEELLSIYSEAKLCIRSDRKVSDDLQQLENAILEYVATVENLNLDREDLRKIKAMNSSTRFKELCLKGENEFSDLMKYSRNEKVLEFVWLGWRENFKAMTHDYSDLVRIENEAARRNGYDNIGAVWRDELEILNLRDFCTELLDDIKELYELIHGITRFSLRIKYGNSVPRTGPIPAHLLGDLWSHSWDSILDLIVPKAKQHDLCARIKKKGWSDIEMVKKAEDFYVSLGLHPMTRKFWENSIFERTDNRSISFRNAASCHGSSGDMYKRDDYRLLYCTKKSLYDFYVLHHEMGHIEYYMAYSLLPTLYRSGANSAFHEAIGDTIMYGVLAPQHLHRLGLIADNELYLKTTAEKSFKPDLEELYLDSSTVPNERLRYNSKLNEKTRNVFETLDTGDKSVLTHSNRLDKAQFNNDNVLDSENNYLYEKTMAKSYDPEYSDIERKTAFDDYDEVSTQDLLEEFTIDDIFLLRMALEKIPHIAYAFVTEEFRYRLFEGSLASDWNDEYWQLVLKYQGVSVPEGRKRSGYFDIGAKFHVPDNTPYIRYFLSNFIDAQLFKSMCEATVFGWQAHDELPATMLLHRCDIYGSKTAGQILRDIMSRGSSVPWATTLKLATGQDRITSDALLQYYKPLTDKLRSIVAKHAVPIGW